MLDAIDAGADVNVVNKNGQTALEIADKTGCTEKIQLPLKQVIQRNKEKQTVTNIAIEQKYTKPSAMRQAWGQEVRNSKVELVGHPIADRIGSFLGGKRRTKRKTNTFRKVRSKRQRGGNQDEKDTYLFDAIAIYDYDKVEDALNNGANVNALNNDGDTPLILAIKSEDIDMVYLLLERPDIDIELDVDTNKELQLAEELTPEDEEQNGIPYAIEDYIITKKEKKRIQSIVAQTIPGHLKRQEDRKNLAMVMSEKNVGNVGDGTMPYELRYEIGKYLGGGKRRTRKSKRSKRKSKRQ